jgi:AcrR family transcriptional regulator
MDQDLRPARWRRRREARPQELLEAALSVFAEKGFTAARLDEIAARAGVSKGTLYLYFPSKEALLEALIDAAILPRIERVERLAARWPGSSARLLRTIARMVARVLRHERIVAFPKLVIAEATNFPAFAERYRRRVIDRGVALLAGVIARGIERGELRPVDPGTAARLFVAPVLFAAIWQTCFARPDAPALDPEALLRTHLDIFLRGLAVDERP